MDLCRVVERVMLSVHVVAARYEVTSKWNKTENTLEGPRGINVGSCVRKALQLLVIFRTRIAVRLLYMLRRRTRRRI